MKSTVATTIFPGEESVRQAHGMIHRHIRETPVERALSLECGDGEVWLKLEHLQVTGSFKVRGAFASVSMLLERNQIKGMVASSAGNHALGIAHVADHYGLPAIVFVPSAIDEFRSKTLADVSVELRLGGSSLEECERKAREFAAAEDLAFISAYNDPAVVAGQGTIGIEVLKQIPDVEVLFVAVGGGALISGVGAYVKAVRPGVTIVGVAPANSAAMYDVTTGIPMEFASQLETIADSIVGPVEAGSVTIDLCKALIDYWVLVEERDIAAAMRYLFFEHRIVSEGAGALAVAAFLKESERFKDKTCGLLVCGGNIDPNKFLAIVKP